VAVSLHTPVHTLQALRDVVASAAAGLQRHQALAGKRGVYLPEGLADLLEALQADLKHFAQMQADSNTEITQLRMLARTAALINASLDIDTVLAQAMDELVGLLGAERGFILLVNEDNNRVEFRISRGVNVDEFSRDEVSRTILRRVLSEGQPILTDNAMADPRLKDIDTVGRFELRSIMCVPLRLRGHDGASARIGGAIYVDNKFREAVFRERELTLLTAFANQAAVAVDNATLFAQVQATLQEISRAREIMENVFTSIESGVLTTDTGGAVQLVNRAAGEILRVEPPALAGQPLNSALPALHELVAHELRLPEHATRSPLTEVQPEVSGRGRVVLNVRVSRLRAADGRTQGAAMVLDDLTEERERDETLALVRRYLPPGMLENIHQIADLAMGGERREVTCVFMTACQYAAFPAGMRPAQIMERLNVYLEAATQVIHRFQGVIDKVLGNEIMILFNTQLNPDVDHARRAVEMALAMREAYAALAGTLGEDPAQPQYAMAMHTGVATLGNVGSTRRRSFTAIGDTINLAYRIHERVPLGQIVLTGETLAHVQASMRAASSWRFEARGVLQARGRQAETALYEVLHA
jgi:adenylate cyclase